MSKEREKKDHTYMLSAKVQRGPVNLWLNPAAVSCAEQHTVVTVLVAIKVGELSDTTAAWLFWKGT